MKDTKVADIFTEDINNLTEHLNIVINAHNRQLDKIDQLTNELKEFKEEHKIMKQIIIENGLWERLLNDDRFLKYLRSDDNDIR